jgi:hypothetical protein
MRLAIETTFCGWSLFERRLLVCEEEVDGVGSGKRSQGIVRESISD